MDDEMKLIHTGKRWVVARRVPATAYGAAARELPEYVWQDPETTALLCDGYPVEIHDLPPDPTP